MSTQVDFDSELIHLGIGQPDPALLPVAHFQRGHCDWQSLAYGDQAGDFGFRQSLSVWLTQEYGQPVGADELMISNGASNGLDMICHNFARRGQTVLVEDPTYFIARQLFASHGLQVVSVPMQADGVDMERLAALVREHRPAFFYCIPSFHNPTGRSWSAAKRRALVALAQQQQCLVVADEVYQHLYFEDSPPPPLACLSDTAPVLSVHTFSKVLAPGLRLGWIQSRHPHLQTLIDSPLLRSGGGLAPMTSAWVQPLLESGDFEHYLRFLRREYRQRCRTLCSVLRQQFGDEAEFDEPQGGYFVWLRLASVSDSERLLPAARAAGTAFMPGRLFSDSDHWRGHLRLCFALQDKTKLAQGVERLRSASQSL